MTAFWLQNKLHSASRGIRWSDTKKLREVSDDPKRWYASDADKYPLGPYPEEMKQAVAAHWCLTQGSIAKLPKTHTLLTAYRFTGVPLVTRDVADVFKTYGGDGVELFQVPKFWSMKDKSEITTPYFFVNLFGTAPTIDVENSWVSEGSIERLGRSHILESHNPKKMRIHPTAHGDLHIWRDRATHIWFCTKEFFDALDAVAPKTYEIEAIEASGRLVG